MSKPECNPAAAWAALLAGGRSRRFGSDKARVVIDGVPLLRRNHDLLAAAFPHVAVVGPPADTYADLGLVCVPDDTPHRGPMAGLIAALRGRLAAGGPGVVAVSACDALLTHDAVDGLRAMAAALADSQSTPAPLAAAGHDGQRWQPLFAAYHTDALPGLRAALATDRSSPRRWLDAPAHHAVRFTDRPGPASFNTPQELARLEP